MAQSAPSALDGGPARPDGLNPGHAAPRAWHRHASPASLLILGAFLALAFAGSFGGQPNPVRQLSNEAVAVRVKAPAVIRNGEFFEARVEIAARRPIEALSIGISPDLWRDLTINTMIPAAAGESFEDGEYRFDYGALAAGSTLQLKIDGQINPPLFAGTRGFMTIRDGGETIARLPLSMRVLP